MSFIKLLPLKMMGLTRGCLSRTSEKPANRAIQSEPLKFAQPLNTPFDVTVVEKHRVTTDGILE